MRARSHQLIALPLVAFVLPGCSGRGEESSIGHEGSALAARPAGGPPPSPAVAPPPTPASAPPERPAKVTTARERIRQPRERMLHDSPLDGHQKNELILESILEKRRAPLADNERWLVYYTTREGSVGPYDMRRMKYGVIDPLVDRGDPDALYEYARAAVSGSGIPGEDQDIEKGARLYLRAAEAGHVDAMHSLGWMHLRGNGVQQDPGRALAWFVKFDGKSPSVQVRRRIADIYRGRSLYGYRGEGGPRDEAKAQYWDAQADALAAAQGGDPLARRRSADREKARRTEARLTEGIEDPNEVLDRYELSRVREMLRGIDAGEVEPAMELAFMFEKGIRPFYEDQLLAARYYEKAGDLGRVDAYAHAGQSLVFCERGACDAERGLALLHKAYDLESSYYTRMRILDMLVKAYSEGPPEVRNPTEADRWHARKGEERERVRTGGLPAVHKRWGES